MRPLFLVEGNRVAAIWESNNVPSNLIGGFERISIQDKILSPGFIDSHMHVWQSVFRTIALNAHMGDYESLYGPLGQPQYHLEPNDIYYGTLESIYESFDSGTTTIVENPHHNWYEEISRAGWEASYHSGARVHWAWSIGLSSGIRPSYDLNAQVDAFRRLHAEKEWRDTPAELGLNFDNFTAGAPEVIKTVVDLAFEFNVSAVHANHIGYPFVLDNRPKSLLNAGLLNSTIPVGYGSSREHNQYIAIAPESEMQHGHDQSMSHLFLDQAALGVDNNMFFSTSMQQQARLWMQATRRRLFAEAHELNRVRNTTGFDVNQAYHLVTRSGGLALHRDDLGVIKVGALADLTVFDGDSANMLGWSDPIAAIIMHSQVGDVRHVLVNGEWRKYNGKLLDTPAGESWESVKKNFAKVAKRVHAIWADIPRPLLTGRVSGGGAEYIDLPKVNVTREQFAGT
ncbi:hypothetical protein BS50DRAFT_594650 [Corynespora cassiicola Philippines]|uniref:Amidohydrolase-related domain-containing protein n=1 Tax=Corynespora cassiicola Philippines TaxID=1448308 RepID=A0A2T2N2D1_CORCC|nr:hypothetical protein BS50DRAFT_594650 [Corynespora cassiicola Philippines]